MSNSSRIARIALAFATFVFAAAAAAQSYPSKPIRIIVPFAAGGTSDILARFISPKLTEAWGQPVIVENKTGANGNVAAEYVSRSAPDGYTVMLGDIGALSIAPSVYPTLPFDPVKDFSPIVMVSYSPHILAVHPSVPVSNVKELIAYAKARPGSSISPSPAPAARRTSPASSSSNAPACNGPTFPTRAARRPCSTWWPDRRTYCSTACLPPMGR